MPAWSQDSVYCVCCAKEGRLTGTLEHAGPPRGNAHSETNFSKPFVANVSVDDALAGCLSFWVLDR